MRLRLKKRQPTIDRGLLIATLVLVSFGLIMVFSASAVMAEARYGSAYLFIRKQILWDILGIMAMVVCMKIDYHTWQRLAYPLLGISLILLVAVLIIGPEVKGARRWIPLGPITFQPSEIAKLALVLSLANFLDRHKSDVDQFLKGFLPALALVGITCGLIVIEPDLGTPMMLGSVSMIMLFLAGARIRHMVSVVAVSLIPLYFLLFHVGYRRRRLMAFLNPWADPQGAGYQVTQSLMAFGSGGFFGKGLGASTLKELHLPDPHTDFIFPIIGEELGFLGAAAVILLFVFWGIRGWKIVRRGPDLFGQLLAAGITSWILLQAMINMGVSCGIFPTKGLPLPFVSFGGSSLVITLAAVGILLNISGLSKADTTPAYRRRRQMRARHAR
jgi:cell division protein FtsW